MFSKEATIMKGMLSREPPAIFILQKAYNFKSDIWVENNGHKADAKKLLDILSIGIKCGDTITFTANGDDETEAVETLVNLVTKDYLYLTDSF